MAAGILDPTYSAAASCRRLLLASRTRVFDKHNVLLVADEVICSWGRLGHYFGVDRFNVVPDLITTAKGLTSSYAPMGAVIVSDRVADPFMSDPKSFTHGITFGGHPVSAAVAMANLDVFEREDLCGHVLAKSRFPLMLDSCTRTCRSCATCAARLLPGARAGQGQGPNESFIDLKRGLLRGFMSGELFKHGLICRADDRGDPVIQLSPPLIADSEEFEIIDRVLRQVLTEAWDRIVRH